MRSFENFATLIVRDRNGHQMRASAILYQDAHFLHSNRISLIGAREKELELFRLDTDGVIDWEMFVRSDWKVSDDPSYSHHRSGTGWVRSNGMTMGVMIADESIQPFADIEILESIDRLRDRHLSGARVEYVFLQRPRTWDVRRRSWRIPDPPRLAGRWTPLEPWGVRFRLLRLLHRRDDERLAKEYERIELPGIEFEPIDKSGDDEAFFASAERLWFVFRVLLAFRFRQFIHTLVETRVGAGRHDTTWHTERLEPATGTRRSQTRRSLPDWKGTWRRGQLRYCLWRVTANFSTRPPLVMPCHTARGRWRALSPHASRALSAYLRRPSSPRA